MENKHEQSLDLALAISEALDIALDHPDRRLDPVMSGVLLAYIKERLLNQDEEIDRLRGKIRRCHAKRKQRESVNHK